jgi:D-glycero-D-manno-heptose 1,7-bisphosphate phosphatase
MTKTPNELVPAVFLDRDGTIIEEVSYCSDPENVKVFPGVPAALEKLRARGFKLIVVSNQAGIGRGYFGEKEYRAVEARVAEAILPATLDATYFCPEHPDGASARRKPGAGMVLEAEAEHGIDLTRSFFVGDKSLDIECGRNAGVRTILVKTGYGGADAHNQPDWIAEDLCAAAEIILAQADG